MNDYYSKDTIDAKLDSIHETLLRIEAQTIKTNGRVTDLEMKNANRSGEARIWAIVAGFSSSLIFVAIEYIMTRGK